MIIINVLWIAVALLVISAIIPRSYHIRKAIGGMGWSAFLSFKSQNEANLLSKTTPLSVTLVKNQLTKISWVGEMRYNGNKEKLKCQMKY